VGVESIVLRYFKAFEAATKRIGLNVLDLLEKKILAAKEALPETAAAVHAATGVERARRGAEEIRRMESWAELEAGRLGESRMPNIPSSPESSCGHLVRSQRRLQAGRHFCGCMLRNRILPIVLLRSW
jgi:hypothetical protein